MRETGDYESVTLQRADRAAGLWPAIEAAQYGHIVQRDDTDASEEVKGRIDAFLAVLSEIIEGWEATSAEGQAALMRRLDAEIAALHKLGSRVHWRTPDSYLRLCHKLFKSPRPRNNREVTRLRLTLESLHPERSLTSH